MSKTKTVAKAKLEGNNPKQHKVKVQMTDGSAFEILTTWGKEDSVLHLDVDPKNHPAWQEKGGNFINANNEMVSKFKNKFGDFDFVSSEKK
jgi:large subunit ribosomal protein L31